MIDDGSDDGTHRAARRLGVDQVVRFPERRGLAAAFLAGLDEAARRGADVVIAEPTISREHAAIAYAEGRFFVEDLGSTNGTQVNGERKPRQPLVDGDEIQLGKLRLRITLPG